MDEQSASRGERAFHHRDERLGPDSAQDLPRGGTFGVEGAVPAEEDEERLGTHHEDQVVLAG